MWAELTRSSFFAGLQALRRIQDGGDRRCARRSSNSEPSDDPYCALFLSMARGNGLRRLSFFVAMRATPLLIVIVMACGCHRSQSGPPDYPPMPPPSATPIGLLRAHDVDLGLSAEQLASLKELDDSLQARNRGLERELEELLAPPRPRRPPGGGPGGGRGGPPGGGGGGGMGGGPPPGGEGEGENPDEGAGGRPGPPKPPPLTDEQRERADRVREQMEENQRSFLQRALELLTAEQREKAQALLSD